MRSFPLFAKLALLSLPLVATLAFLSFPLFATRAFLADSASTPSQVGPPRPSPEPPFPTPPRQAEPWTAPDSNLPPRVVAATADLFAQGLADPRGCEYRKIRITVGALLNEGGSEVETSGWVLPASEPGTPGFAIAWSGVVYPLAGIGGPADLDADVGSMGGPEGRNIPISGILEEQAATAVETMTPIRACLLLRLGRADLAERLWAAGVRPGNKATNRQFPIGDGINYLTLAQDLAWHHFERAICAHMRGDDAVALAEVRFLAPFEKAVEARAAKLNYPRPQWTNLPGSPYIIFLTQLPAFLADQERRARERTTPMDEPNGDAPGDRIAALIRDLDQVAARQWSEPGGVAIGGSPIVQALIDQGDAAVDALIRDFRSEDRLTRSVSFHRSFHRSRMIHRADEAAYAALQGILQTSRIAASYRPEIPPSRQETADRIEEYWKENRGTRLVERWYRILADDSAGQLAWLEAANRITQPTNVQFLTGGGAFGTVKTTHLAPGERPPLHGEALREGHDPTVSDLMTRRVEAIVRTPEGPTAGLDHARQAVSCLAAWDPAAALPLLREVMQRCREQFARAGDEPRWQPHGLAVSIAEFTEARIRAGDAEAIPEYAAWLRTTTPSRLDHDALQVLKPMSDRPDDPTLAAAAAWLFGDPASPWLPLVGRRKEELSYSADQMVASSLLDVPAFRAAVLSGLEDRTPIGWALAQGRDLRINIDDGPRIGTTLPADDPSALKGQEQPVRRRDYLAWLLASLEGAPPFNPCWDEAKRDAAVLETAAFLRRRVRNQDVPR